MSKWYFNGLDPSAYGGMRLPDSNESKQMTWSWASFLIGVAAAIPLTVVACIAYVSWLWLKGH